VSRHHWVRISLRIRILRIIILLFRFLFIISTLRTSVSLMVAVVRGQGLSVTRCRGVMFFVIVCFYGVK